MKFSLWILGIAAVIALMALLGFFYIVPETEQVIVTQFGKPVGSPVKQAGLHLKLPFIQQVNRFEKRVLEWDGPSAVMTTKDKLFIIVDTFGRWQINDPLRFFLRLRDERSAQSRLDDIIGGETRNTIARHQLVELVRTTKGRRAAVDEALVAPPTPLAAGQTAITGLPAVAGLPPIQYGRVSLEQEITKEAKTKLLEFGIELLDVRFMRINYNPDVTSKIFDRMVSERRQIAQRFRSEGAGEAAKIIGAKERDMKQIESEAYRKVQAVQGKADAEAIAIYAQAYNQSPEAREFYAFTRTLETYRTSFQQGTTMVLTTDSGFLQFLKGGTLVQDGKIPELPGRTTAPATTSPRSPQALPAAPDPLVPPRLERAPVSTPPPERAPVSTPPPLERAPVSTPPPLERAPVNTPPPPERAPVSTPAAGPSPAPTTQ